MDLDLALRTDKSVALTAASTADQKRDFEKWDRSNRMCLMIMKRGIPESFKGHLSDEVTTKELLEQIEKRFLKNDKAEISTTLLNLISVKYKGQGNIREYIMEMSHLASKLKALKLELSNDLLVHIILISLPTQFNQFKISYNCQKEKCYLNELMCKNRKGLSKRRLKVLIWPVPLKANKKKGKWIRKLQALQLKRNTNKINLKVLVVTFVRLLDT
ncbi:hypothetical protein SOVF_049610 [Spinacia oleracea]|nr:hypothetical protein SOVF_049610 [Spinacia oleracea]